MSNKLCYYICTVTKAVPDSINFFEEEEEYGYGLPWKDILAEVKQHYKDGALAVLQKSSNTTRMEHLQWN